MLSDVRLSTYHLVIPKENAAFTLQKITQMTIDTNGACLGGAIGSVAVRAAWLR